MASAVYKNGALSLTRGQNATGLATATRWAGAGADNIGCLLVNSAYAFDQAHDYVDDVVANEISVGGYARQTPLGGATLALDGNATKLDATDPVFTALVAGQTVGGAIIYCDTPALDSGKTLLCFLDTTDTPTNGGNITIQFNASGVMTLTPS